ncbi:hypothetical protein Tco_0806530 [Tanacetum coccineum]
MGSDEIEVSDDESSDLKEYWSDKEEETFKIFKIETNVFDYETPLCLAFNEFNYLLNVDLDLLTNDSIGFKTYEDYKDDWIYEWKENVPWVYDKQWLDNGIWKEPKPDGYCNGGNLPGAYHIVNSLHYQDLEWYEALEDSKLKDEALRSKAIIEGKDIKVKKSKNEQKPTRNEETSTREILEANIESRIKTVVEKRQESKEKDKGNDHYTL